MPIHTNSPLIMDPNLDIVAPVSDDKCLPEYRTIPRKQNDLNYDFIESVNPGNTRPKSCILFSSSALENAGQPAALSSDDTNLRSESERAGIIDTEISNESSASAFASSEGEIAKVIIENCSQESAVVQNIATSESNNDNTGSSFDGNEDSNGILPLYVNHAVSSCSNQNIRNMSRSASNQNLQASQISDPALSSSENIARSTSSLVLARQTSSPLLSPQITPKKPSLLEKLLQHKTSNVDEPSLEEESAMSVYLTPESSMKYKSQDLKKSQDLSLKVSQLKDDQSPLSPQETPRKPTMISKLFHMHLANKLQLDDSDSLSGSTTSSFHNKTDSHYSSRHDHSKSDSLKSKIYVPHRAGMGETDTPVSPTEGSITSPKYSYSNAPFPESLDIGEPMQLEISSDSDFESLLKRSGRKPNTISGSNTQSNEDFTSPSDHLRFFKKDTKKGSRHDLVDGPSETGSHDSPEPFPTFHFHRKPTNAPEKSKSHQGFELMRHLRAHSVSRHDSDRAKVDGHDLSLSEKYGKVEEVLGKGANAVVRLVVFN
jgi:hypothetical protein